MSQLFTLLFCNDTATTDIYTYGHILSLHDARPIYRRRCRRSCTQAHSTRPSASQTCFHDLRAFSRVASAASCGHSVAGFGMLREIGRAHVCTPVTNAHIVCRLLLAQK